MGSTDVESGKYRGAGPDDHGLLAHMFLATDLKRVQDARAPNPNEIMETFMVPLREFPAVLASGLFREVSAVVCAHMALQQLTVKYANKLPPAPGFHRARVSHSSLGDEMWDTYFLADFTSQSDAVEYILLHAANPGGDGTYDVVDSDGNSTAVHHDGSLYVFTEVEEIEKIPD